MTRFLPYLALGVLSVACTRKPPPDKSPDATTDTEVIPPEDTGGEPEPINYWEAPISDAIVPGDPDWNVESWTRIPEGMPAPTLEFLLGKTVVIFAFQHW